jgi:hypothetical protein
VPKDWPEVTTPKYVTATSLSELLKEYSAKPGPIDGDAPPSALDRYIPPAGWIIRLADVTLRRADNTCDRQAIEATSSRPLLLKNLAGGCTLEPGQRLVVFGKVEDLTDEQVSLGAVRVFPADL